VALLADAALIDVAEQRAEPRVLHLAAGLVDVLAVDAPQVVGVVAFLDALEVRDELAAEVGRVLPAAAAARSAGAAAGTRALSPRPSAVRRYKTRCRCDATPLDGREERADGARVRCSSGTTLAPLRPPGRHAHPPSPSPTCFVWNDVSSTSSMVASLVCTTASTNAVGPTM
jgi:hypothetical protein